MKSVSSLVRSTVKPKRSEISVLKFGNSMLEAELQRSRITIFNVAMEDSIELDESVDLTAKD